MNNRRPMTPSAGGAAPPASVFRRTGASARSRGPDDSPVGRRRWTSIVSSGSSPDAASQRDKLLRVELPDPPAVGTAQAGVRPKCA